MSYQKAMLMLAIVLVLTPVASGAEAVPTGWKAGFARESIIPKTEVWLAGYGTKRVPQGQLHELWMKAFALEDPQGNQIVLVTSDFQGIPRSMSDRVFENALNEWKLDRSQLMITFSHNHCGPRLGDDLIDYYPVEPDQERLVSEYTTLMVEKMTSMIGRALKSLEPATLQIGEGTCDFAVNRRNNKEAEIPSLLASGTPLLGPVDHSVPVLTVTSLEGKLKGILFGYACHPTTLSFEKWCGDYPGFAQLRLEEQHPDVTALFVNTCGGDQNPLPRRTVELCEKYGLMLADGVQAALQKPLKPVSPSLKAAFSFVELPYEKVVTRQELEVDAQGANRIKSRWAKRLLNQLDQGKTFDKAYTYPVRVWQIGNEMLVIGQGGESVVDYSLRFRGEYGPGTWVMGYADDMAAYIPSKRVWNEGGYEGGAFLYEYGRPAYRWSSEVEDRIATTVENLVRQVRSTP